ncbi:hypothetical protein BZG36_05517 [Bifiguratus adelaidae]|uniref:DUF914-domain-containing protein n=1 Tax=Bifiguratus adelaidae TaxID=1938954 RepID=A0A261XTH5_9FUNG|nr:hypothetical protein BZG36_05517 [Bifiguratus adelaidae]
MASASNSQLSPSDYVEKTEAEPRTLEQTEEVITYDRENASTGDEGSSTDKRMPTWSERLAFYKSRHFIEILLMGQFLSLCITATNVTTAKLANDYGIAMPTTQTFLNYVILAIVYNIITLWKHGFRYWGRALFKRGIWYLILGIIDVEGNYFVVKAYAYTSLLSAMLLDAWSIPVVMFLSFILLKARYRWMQFLGVVICLCGLGGLVASDFIIGNSYQAVDPVKGDLFMILGATFYGFSNVGEERLVRTTPLYEVVGMFTLFAAIVNFIQLMILERNEFSTFVNQPEAIGMWVAYTAAMFCLYTVAPILFRKSSATFFNLSLLTSDFYGLLFGLFLFHYSPYPLYFVAYVLVIVGLLIYHLWPAPEPKIGNFDAERKQQVIDRTMGRRTEDVEAGRD